MISQLSNVIDGGLTASVTCWMPLTKANKTEPDSGAAATLIEALNRFYDMEINTSELKKDKDRIHSEFNELSQKYVKHREEISGMYMWSKP